MYSLNAMGLEMELEMDKESAVWMNILISVI